jgi:hypothetical protein
VGSESGIQAVPDSLLRLFERPGAQLAVAVAGPSGLAAWRETLGGRRRLVAAGLTPVLLWAFASQVGGLGAVGSVWLLPLGLIATLSALTLATYVPAPGAGAGTSPCASIAGVYVLFAAMALGGPPIAVANVLLALAMAGFGLSQRLRGARACGS